MADDLLGVVKLTGPQVNRLIQKLIGFFDEFDLKITVQGNVKRSYYLDILDIWSLGYIAHLGKISMFLATVMSSQIILLISLEIYRI